MPDQLLAECLDCGTYSEYSLITPECPKCGSTWREAHYDLTNLTDKLIENLPSRPFNLWRYAEILPVKNTHPDISLGEGGTPLLRAVNLGMMLGCPNIFIKDERQGPTHSFKDRQAAVSIAAFKEAGIQEVVVASTGNVAIAYSAYAARAGIKLWAFLTSLVPAAKMREVALYGTQVIKVTGSYDQTKKIAADFARQRGIHIDLGSRSIPCIEAMKTIALETAEQLTSQVGPPDNENGSKQAVWRAPDWYFQSVSGGMGPLGVIKGFNEMYEIGLVNKLPRLGMIQVEGCSPMVHAWKQNRDLAIPVQSSTTLIATLATGDPGRSYSLLRQKMLSASGGVFESVTDEEAFRAMHFLAKMEGISVEPAAAVSFAGLIKLVRAGVIKPTDTIVVNCTGHTMPIERNILGDSRSRDLDLPARAMEENPEEGLLAALSRVGIDRFPRIAVVDDNPDARRLICRILQSQGNFSIFEATNGQEAVDLIHNQRPNLIILDLMMPEMDGFAVMDRLQSDPATADIPIIVVTAKELTTAEKNRLHGHIQSLMKKGDFLNDDLSDEVRALLG